MSDQIEERSSVQSRRGIGAGHTDVRPMAAVKSELEFLLDMGYWSHWLALEAPAAG
jgi:hypothetical protein